MPRAQVDGEAAHTHTHTLVVTLVPDGTLNVWGGDDRDWKNKRQINNNPKKHTCICSEHTFREEARWTDSSNNDGTVSAGTSWWLICGNYVKKQNLAHVYHVPITNTTKGTDSYKVLLVSAQLLHDISSRLGYQLLPPSAGVVLKPVCF